MDYAEELDDTALLYVMGKAIEKLFDQYYVDTVEFKVEGTTYIAVRTGKIMTFYDRDQKPGRAAIKGSICL